MVMLTPIEKLTPLTRLNPEEKTQGAARSAVETPFGAIFRSAIANVKETDAEYRESQYLLATGQLDNPAMLMIAGTKAQTAVDLLVQLRNKAQDAYSELTRISL